MSATPAKGTEKLYTERGSTRTAPPAKAPPKPASRTRRAVTGAGKAIGTRARAGAVAQGNRATNTVGRVFVVITGAGIAFALLRNPKILTVPLAFITTVITRMTTVFGGKAPAVSRNNTVRAVPVASAG